MDGVRKVWTKESLGEMLKERNQKDLGMRISDIKKEYPNTEYYPSIGYAIKKFWGGYEKAIEELGLKGFPQKQGYWTEERITEMLYKRQEQGLGINVDAIRDEMGGAMIWVYRKYGSWNLFIEKIGLREQPEDILTDIRTRYENGQSLLLTDVRKEDRYLVRRIYYKYGKWENAVRAVGIDYEQYKEQLLAEQKIDRIEKLHHTVLERYRQGKSMEAKNVKEEDKELYKEVMRLYGGFKKMYERMGIQPKKETVWTKERILTAIKEKYERGESLRWKEVKADMPYMVTCAQQVYGKWMYAVMEATGITEEAYKETYLEVRNLSMQERT